MKFEFIYGGSFDPLHKGHVNLVKEVIQQINKLSDAKSHENAIHFRFLPCAVPALKNASTSSFADRSDKLKEIFTEYFLEQKIGMQVDEREELRSIETGSKSYTIDSLKELKVEGESIIRFLVVGADNFNHLAGWKNVLELSKYCNLVVINRAGESLNDWSSLASDYGFIAKQNIEHLLETKTAGFCFYLEISEVDISSTEIREKVKNNQLIKDWLA